MRYKETRNREQLSLFNSLEDLVSDNNHVRLIDALLNQLSQKEGDKFKNGKGNKQTGRKAYSPLILSKMFLYGYLNRIVSSRRLEAESHRNIELMWLLQGEHPDHKTISDFRKDNSVLIRYVTTSFRLFLKAQGFIKGETVSYDGTKMKAYTRNEAITLQGVTKRLTHLEREVEKYLTQMEKVDTLESVEEQVSEKALEKTRLECEIANLKSEMSELQTYKQAMQDKGQTSHCQNDPDAQLMLSRGGYIPAYNVQMGVDAENKMIAYAQVTSDCNDIQALEENVKSTERELGEAPKSVIADYGYGNVQQIKAVESNEKTTCYIPLVESPNAEKDKLNGVSFTYDQENDVVVCSQGQTLFPLARNVKQRGVLYTIYRTQKGVCSACSLFGKCTKSPQGRNYQISEHAQYRNKCLERQQTEAFQKVFKRRKGMVEHPFGTLKVWMGKIPLLLRSRKKVQIEIDLYTTAYNLRRLLALRSISELMQMVAV